MAVTARDVAREAGVSLATVSYVVNDHPTQRVSPATRARVLAVVDRLGYRPSEAARTLRRGTSDTVLLLLPDVPIGATLAQLIEVLTDELEGARLRLATRRMPAAGPLREVWAGLRPVAVAVVGAIGDADAEELRAAGVPLVGSYYDSRSPAVEANVPQRRIGRLQVEHLAATGRTVIGYAAPDDSRVSEFHHLRLDGVRLSCLDLGLADPVVLPVQLDVSSAEDAVAEWLACGVTAVACYNDETAFAVLAGMHRLGLAAPEDLAVIGVDNIPLAALASPPLTTIDQNVDQVAKHLAGLVVHELRGTPRPRSLPADPITLVLRESA